MILANLVQHFLAMLTKEQVLKSFQSLPDQFDEEEAHERIALLAAIREGIEDVDNGRTITLEEMKARIAAWRR